MRLLFICLWLISSAVSAQQYRLVPIQPAAHLLAQDSLHRHRYYYHSESNHSEVKTESILLIESATERGTENGTEPRILKAELRRIIESPDVKQTGISPLFLILGEAPVGEIISSHWNIDDFPWVHYMAGDGTTGKCFILSSDAVLSGIIPVVSTDIFDVALMQELLARSGQY